MLSSSSGGPTTERPVVLDEATLKTRAEGSLATPIYVPTTRGAPPASSSSGGDGHGVTAPRKASKVSKLGTARSEEEAYQESIKQRAAGGQALTPDEIFRRARQAGSLAV